MTIDDVTVRVADITDKITDSRISTEIEGPNGGQHLVSVSPMMVVLGIENGTDHIITLRRTIITVEDDNLNEFPLISSLHEGKVDLSKRVDEVFDAYLTSVSEQYKDTVYGDYAEEHRVFSEKLTVAAKMSFGDSMGDAFFTGLIGGELADVAPVRTSDMQENKILTAFGIKSKIETTSPASVYANGQNQLQSRVLMVKASAIQKISSEIQVREKNIITSGDYQPIRILPGRTVEIIAPFSSPGHNQEIDSLVINVYDLPTRLNEAADPIKRANFSFPMVAEN